MIEGNVEKVDEVKKTFLVCLLTKKMKNKVFVAHVQQSAAVKTKIFCNQFIQLEEKCVLVEDFPFYSKYVLDEEWQPYEIAC